MTDQDAASLQRQLRQLYGRQAFAEALELVRRQPGMFRQPGLRYHWQMCLAARADRPDEAIAALGDALDRGYAYPAAAILDDEDLATLQRLPAFEALARRSIERMTEVEARARAQLVVVPPAASPDGRAPLLLGLHGNAQNASIAAADWAPVTDRGWVLGCAQSTQVFTSDAYMWNDLVRGADDVRRLFATLDTHDAIDPGRIVVGGFSMGGGLAVQLAVSGAIGARGFIVVGPYLPDLEPLRPHLAAAAARGLRGYVVMGLEESSEGQGIIRGLHAFLNEHGIACELEERPGLEHAFPADADRMLDRALAFLG